MLRPTWALTLVCSCRSPSEAGRRRGPPQPEPYPPQPFQAARPAHAFTDSVGVNVHMSYIDTSSRDVDAVRSRLRELGVRHVRDGLCATCEYQIDALKKLAAAGIKADLIIGDLKGGSAKMREGLRAIRQRLGGAVESVEAPNEPDAEGARRWPRRTRDYQADSIRG